MPPGIDMAHIDLRVGHVTCFHQWYVSNWDWSRGLIRDMLCGPTSGNVAATMWGSLVCPPGEWKATWKETLQTQKLNKAAWVSLQENHPRTAKLQGQPHNLGKYNFYFKPLSFGVICYAAKTMLMLVAFITVILFKPHNNPVRRVLCLLLD